MAACQLPFRTRQRQRKTNPCGRPVLSPAPAPGTCTPPCQLPYPGSSGLFSQLRFAWRRPTIPLQGLAILGHAFRQELKGDKAVQPRVFGLVDNTHAAATELLDDAVVRDGLANHGVEVC